MLPLFPDLHRSAPDWWRLLICEQAQAQRERKERSKLHQQARVRRLRDEFRGKPAVPAKAPTPPRARSAAPSPRLQPPATAAGVTGAAAGARTVRCAEEANPWRPDSEQVRLGMQRPLPRCALCERTYSHLPGITFFAAVAERRAEWGDASLCGTARYRHVAVRYEPARLCAFCTQFFDPHDAAAAGSGRRKG